MLWSSIQRAARTLPILFLDFLLIAFWFSGANLVTKIVATGGVLVITLLFSLWSAKRNQVRPRQGIKS